MCNRSQYQVVVPELKPNSTVGRFPVIHEKKVRVGPKLKTMDAKDAREDSYLPPDGYLGMAEFFLW